MPFVENIGAFIEGAIAETKTGAEARELADAIGAWTDAARRRGSALFVREARQRIVERCADPAVREFFAALAAAERVEPGSLGGNGAWQAKLWAVLGKDVTFDLMSCSGIAMSVGDTVEFHADWLAQLATGTFDVDAPWRSHTHYAGTRELHETPLGLEPG